MKTYLFDFDGTLVDSMPTYMAAMLRVLDDNNISYGDDIIKIITPLGVIGTAKYFIELGVKMSVEEIVEKMKDHMKDAYFYEISAKSNVISVLRSLKKEGHSLNLLTASPHLTLDACLKRLEIFDLFDNVWSCDDFSTTKADPEIYRMAAKKLEKDVAEILFIDDNLNADKTAKSAGMKVCGIYDESSRDYKEEIKAACDYYIDDFSELHRIEF